MGKKSLSGRDFRVYNDKVAEFNQRMRPFEEKKSRYVDRVREYYQAGQGVRITFLFQQAGGFDICPNSF